MEDRSYCPTCYNDVGHNDCAACETAELRAEIRRLSSLVYEHHAVGALRDARPGDDCPVCLKHAKK